MNSKRSSDTTPVELVAPDARLLFSPDSGRRRTYRVGELVRERDIPYDEVEVVREGWLFSYASLADGRRQVLRLYLAGDIIGLDSMPHRRAAYDVEAGTPATVSVHPKEKLGMLFAHRSPGAELLWRIAFYWQHSTLDRLTALGRFNAAERLLHLYLHLHDRLSVRGEIDGEGFFAVPLTQDVIGDAVGLTNVYVSRMLAKLKELGGLERRGHRFRLLDVDAIRGSPSFARLAAFRRFSGAG